MYMIKECALGNNETQIPHHFCPKEKDNWGDENSFFRKYINGLFVESYGSGMHFFAWGAYWT